MSLLCQVGRNLLRNTEKVYLNAPKISLSYHSLLQPYRCYVQRHDYKNDIKEKFIPFDKLSIHRREEAKRSILVQVNSEESFAELQSYCLQFGDVQGVYHFVVSAGHFMLIEFSKESEASSVLKCSNHVTGTGVPTRSPYLWFRADNNKSKTRKRTALTSSSQDVKLLAINGLNIPKDDEIDTLLLNAKDIEEQILILYKSTCLSDLGVRLRYFTARQVELILCGLFPNVTVRPFGSSVSGFGKQGCDLDLVLRLDNDEPKADDCRFVFHTKTSLSNGRINVQKQMEVVSDLLQLFTPGCANVRRILQARVPIIKYYQEYVGLECDLSMTNLTGVYMSELLYILGSIDSRVCPLMFAIRKWAQSVGITNPSPGRWISNFSLSLLVIYSLQQNGKNNAVLPKIKHLIDNAGKEDFRMTEEHINCTFLRDINNQNIWDLNNTDSLYNLLLNFFEFYSTFDFNSHAISVIKGIPVSKPDHSPMYIINPLETQLNVCKNVSYEEMQKFRIEVRNAAWLLESYADSDRNQAKPWGLLNIFQNHQLSIKAPGFLLSNKKSRLMEVKQLFDDDGKLIDFKNEDVKQQIGDIKKKVKLQVKKFKSPRARRR